MKERRKKKENSRQKSPTEFPLAILPTNRDPPDHAADQLRAQQFLILMQRRELGHVGRVHDGRAGGADHTLHLRVDGAGTDGEGGDERLLDGEREREMVLRCFGRAVRAPCRVGRR